MSKIFFPVSALLLGLAMMFASVQESVITWNSQGLPMLKFDVAQIEQGKSLESWQATLGPHLALYGNLLYTEFPSPRDGRTVENTSYAVVSGSHPYIQKLKPLRKKYGSLAAIPAEEIPPLKSFDVLVHTSRFKTENDFPSHMKWEKGGQLGVFTHAVTDINKELQKKLEAAYPEVEPCAVTGKKAAIFHEAREVWSPMQCAQYGGGGLILTLLAGFWLRSRSRSS